MPLLVAFTLQALIPAQNLFRFIRLKSQNLLLPSLEKYLQLFFTSFRIV